MKILCVSDTHGSTFNLEKAIKREEGIDLLLHAGDHIVDIESIDANFNRVAVKGNGDRRYEGNLEEIISIGEKKILLTHGHNHRVKYGLTNLSYKAIEAEVNIVVFGHTHRSLKLEEDRILFLNPGSLTYPRDGSLSYIILIIEGEEVQVKIKEL